MNGPQYGQQFWQPMLQRLQAQRGMAQGGPPQGMPNGQMGGWGQGMPPQGVPWGQMRPPMGQAPGILRPGQAPQGQGAGMPTNRAAAAVDAQQANNAQQAAAANAQMQQQRAAAQAAQAQQMAAANAAYNQQRAAQTGQDPYADPNIRR